MAKTIKEERLRWVLPIIRNEVSMVDVAKVFPHGKRTLERWVATYKHEGEPGLESAARYPDAEQHACNATVAGQASFPYSQDGQRIVEIAGGLIKQAMRQPGADNGSNQRRHEQ